MNKKYLNIFRVFVIIFTLVIIIGNFFLYLNYKIRYKYEVDLVRYKGINTIELDALGKDIEGILNLSIIIFIYSFSVLFLLILFRSPKVIK